MCILTGNFLLFIDILRFSAEFYAILGIKDPALKIIP